MLKKISVFFIFPLFVSIRLIAQNPWIQKAPYGGGPIAATVGFSIGHYGFIGCGSTVPNWNVSGDQDSFWRWDVYTNTWTQIANYPGGPVELATGFTIEGKGYVCFGWNGAGVTALYQYDTVTSAWTQKATFPGTGRYDVTAFVIGHKAYIIAGNPGGPPYFSDVWVYDAHANTWKQLNNFPETHVEGVVSFSIGNHGYAGDGYNNPGCFTTMYEYDTTADSWTAIAPIPATYGDGGNSTNCTIGSKGYVFNGDKCNTPGYPTGYMYDTVTKAWCAFTDMAASKVSRAFNSAFVINNHIYMGTGYDTIYHNLGDFVEYNPSTKINVKDSSVCIGDSVHFSDSTSYLGVSWSWSFPGGSPSSSNVENPAVSYTSSGIYTVNLILNACGGVDTVSKQINIIINQGPIIALKGDLSVCSGKSDTLKASGGGTYTWSTGATTDTIIISPSSTKTYTLAVSNNGCTKDTSIIVNVGSYPLVILSGNDTICSGSSATLSASGGTSYLWNTGATTSSISDVITSDTTFTVLVSNGACTKDTTLNIIVKPSFPITITGNNVLCAGDSTILSASGGISYTWSTSSTTSSITVKPASTTIYSLEISNGTCIKDTTINITVTPLPIVNITGNTALCLGDSSTLNASGGGTYKWSTGSTFSSIIVRPTSDTTYFITVTNNNCSKDTSIKISVSTINVSISSPVSICYGDTATLHSSGGGTYKWSTGSSQSSISVIPVSSTTYSVIITNGGCIKDTSVAVTVNPLPIAAISGISPICIGDSTTLTVSGGGTYLWNTGQTSNDITVSPSTSATYTVDVTNSFGCKKDTTFEVKVGLPNGTVSGQSSLCLGDTTTLIATGGGTYNWSTGATNNSIVVAPTANTTYSVIINNGCIDTLTKSISVANPVLYACCDTTILTPGTSVILEASGVISYSWSPSAGVSCDTCPNPAVTPTVTTTYTVIGTGANGCKVERTITVDISSCLDPSSIPNVFTPNGDNKNDVFYIDAESVTDFSIEIYNRWGKEMYKSSNANTYWTGRNGNDNSLVSAGVYYYILKYTCNNKSYNKNGFIQVIR
jgi:gliding motility-associated-like protein